MQLGIFGCPESYMDCIGTSRENKLERNHHENVGAVNALAKAFSVPTNELNLLNLERDHHTNNNKALKEILLYNVLEDDK